MSHFGYWVVGFPVGQATLAVALLHTDGVWALFISDSWYRSHFQKESEIMYSKTAWRSLMCWKPWAYKGKSGFVCNFSPTEPTEPSSTYWATCLCHDEKTRNHPYSIACDLSHIIDYQVKITWPCRGVFRTEHEITEVPDLADSQHSQAGRWKGKAKKGHENGEDSIVVGEGKLETPNPDVITWSFVVNTL